MVISIFTNLLSKLTYLWWKKNEKPDNCTKRYSGQYIHKILQLLYYSYYMVLVWHIIVYFWCYPNFYTTDNKISVLFHTFTHISKYFWTFIYISVNFRTFLHPSIHLHTPYVPLNSWTLSHSTLQYVLFYTFWNNKPFWYFLVHVGAFIYIFIYFSTIPYMSVHSQTLLYFYIYFPMLLSISIHFSQFLYGPLKFCTVPYIFKILSRYEKRYC